MMRYNGPCSIWFTVLAHARETTFMIFYATQSLSVYRYSLRIDRQNSFHCVRTDRSLPSNASRRMMYLYRVYCMRIVGLGKPNIETCMYSYFPYIISLVLRTSSIVCVRSVCAHPYVRTLNTLPVYVCTYASICYMVIIPYWNMIALEILYTNSQSSFYYVSMGGKCEWVRMICKSRARIEKEPI